MWKTFISTVETSPYDWVGCMDPISKGMETAVHWFGLNIDVINHLVLPGEFSVVRARM